MNRPRGAETLDGEPLVIRAIQPADREGLHAAFRRLSERSRYQRFLRPVLELTDRDLSYLTKVDHSDHEAVLAIARGDEIVGVARYIRVPDRDSVAEVAVTVTDEWQGRGVGTILLRALAERARAAGIRSFFAVCLAQNQEMLQLLDELGGVVRATPPEEGVVEIEVELPEPAGVQRANALLGAVARAHASK